MCNCHACAVAGASCVRHTAISNAFDNECSLRRSDWRRRHCDAAYVLDGAIDRASLPVETDEYSSSYDPRHLCAQDHGVSALRLKYDNLARHTRDAIDAINLSVMPFWFARSMPDGSVVDPIPIADQVAWGLSPRESPL